MNDHRAPVAVVTGATGGIGRFIARGLAEAGHHVVLVGRDPARGAATERSIRAELPGARTELRIADLGDLRAVERLGRDIATAHDVVALLVNNAGIFTTSRQRTVDGIDAVLAVNHLAPFLLADALEARLRAGAPARIVNVGSSTADRAGIDPEDLEGARSRGFVRAYARSKLAMLMCSFARADRLRGSGVVVNVVHPGLVATGLVRERGVIGLAWRMLAPVARTAAEGAATPLRVALAPEWGTVTGAYAKNGVPASPNPRALDPVLVARTDASTRRLLAHALAGSPPA